jgi:hypothetical protein
MGNESRYRHLTEPSTRYSAAVRACLTGIRGLLVAIVAAGLLTVPAWADTSPPATSEPVTPEAQPQRAPHLKRETARKARSAADRETMNRQQQEFIESVATRLGITAQRLNAAIREARIEFVDKAVAGGKLSREQADRIIQRLTGPQAAQPASPGPGEAVGRGATEAAGQVAGTVSDISVSFKLDPRLTKSLYMGELWVAPTTYSSIREEAVIVDARATALDASGQPLNVNPVWTAEHPDMVSVAPGQAKQVTITVKRAGESVLRVASESVVKELSIKAWYEGSALHVDIDTTRPAARNLGQAEPREAAWRFAESDRSASGADRSQP